MNKEKRILLFEGPDRCGKTEIGSALARNLNITYFKNKSEHENFINEDTLVKFKIETQYLLQQLKGLEYKNNGIVLDRHFPSEYVYSKVYKRKTDEDLIWHFDNEFAKLGTVLIYCYKSEYKYFSDEIIKLEEIGKIRDVYENDYLKKTKMQVISIDTSDEDLDTQLTTIFKKIII